MSAVSSNERSSVWDWLRSLWTASPRASEQGIVPPEFDTPECRAAVHEAGHTVLALRCSIVSRVHSVMIEPQEGTGRVEYDIDIHRQHHGWSSLVIHMGGLAAEGLVYKKFRTGHAASDLKKAYALACGLKELGSQEPPSSWTALSSLIEGRRLSTHIFEGSLLGIRSDEAQMLETARIYAKSILRRAIVQQTRIVSLLLERDGRLCEEDLTAAFGIRGPLFVLGMIRGGFFV